jgi:hypothetical protein
MFLAPTVIELVAVPLTTVGGEGVSSIVFTTTDSDFGPGNPAAFTKEWHNIVQFIMRNKQQVFISEIA